jgi:hypothetical protein
VLKDALPNRRMHGSRRRAVLMLQPLPFGGPVMHSLDIAYGFLQICGRRRAGWSVRASQ